MPAITIAHELQASAYSKKEQIIHLSSKGTAIQSCLVLCNPHPSITDLFMRLYVYSHIAGQYNSDNRYFQLYVDKSISGLSNTTKEPCTKNRLVSLHSQRKTGYKNRLHFLISDHIHQIPVVATLVHNLVLLLHFLSRGTGTTTSSSCPCNETVRHCSKCLESLEA
jgi:hypothetical protein